MGNFKIAGAVAAGAFLCAAAGLAAAEPQLEEIGVFGPYKRASRLVCDGSGERWAFVATDDKNHLYIVTPDGARGPFGNWVDVAFTADGSKLIYVNVTEYDGCYIYANGEAWGPFDAGGTFAANIVAPGGNSWGCWVWEKDGPYALINGELWGTYKTVWPVSFSADGSSWGFKASDGEKWFGVVNGEKVGYHDEPLGTDTIPESGPNEIVFSADGKVWGFTGYKLEGRSILRSHLVINGAEPEPLPGAGDLAISHDGSVWGITAGPRGKAGAVINGRKWPPEGGYVSTRNFTTSDYNGSWAFAASKEELHWFRYVIVNGQEYGPYMGVSEVVFSPDGRQWAATVMKEAGEYGLVINGVEREDLLGYSDLRFSPSGNTWTARARREDGFYRRVDGTDYGPYGYDNSSGEIVFSRDDTTWIIGGDYGPVVVNGEELGVFRDAALFASETETGFFALEKTESGHFRLLRWSTATGEGPGSE